MPKTDRTLMTGLEFKALAEKGATPDDLVDIAILKFGRLVRRSADLAPESRRVSFILSNANLDREGDSISVEGWDTKAYLSNPVVLFGHLHDELPVAKASNVRIAGANLTADDEFVGGDIYPFADTVLRMIRGGFLNACSVGFHPTSFEMSDTGVNFKTQELLEHSICCVPAHPQALVVARSRGIDTAPYARWVEHVLDLEKTPGDGAAKVRKQLERLRAQSDPSGRRLFVALSHVKLPADSVDESEHASLVQMKEMNAIVGTSGTIVANTIDELLGGISRSMKEQTAPSGVPPGTPAHGTGTDDPEEETDRLTIIAQASADAASAAAAVSQMAIDLGGKAPTKAKPALRRRGKSFLEIDDEFDLEDFDLDPKAVAEAVGKVVAEQLMLKTGRVW